MKGSTITGSPQGRNTTLLQGLPASAHSRLLLQDPGRGNKRATYWSRSLKVCCAMAFSLVFASQASAAFVGDYALSKFMLTNVNTDNSDVMTPDGGLSIVFTGGQNNTGIPGLTDFVATAAGTGLVKFEFSYSSLDIPMVDYAGYLLNNAFTQLADTDGQSGSVMFNVSLGQSFGFRVGTDNQFEPGILTVSNFSAPSAGTSSVPEPGTAGAFCIALLAAGALRLGLSHKLPARKEAA